MDHNEFQYSLLLLSTILRKELSFIIGDSRARKLIVLKLKEEVKLWNGWKKRVEFKEAVLKEICLKAQMIGFIFDKKVQIKECDSMVHLTRSTAEGIMSPLKGY